MHLEKHYFRRFFLGIYLVMFIIFCIFAMHPQDVEANSSLILQAPSINLESKIKIIKLNEDYTLTAPDRIAGLMQQRIILSLLDTLQQFLVSSIN